MAAKSGWVDTGKRGPAASGDRNCCFNFKLWYETSPAQHHLSARHRGSRAFSTMCCQYPVQPSPTPLPSPIHSSPLGPTGCATAAPVRRHLDCCAVAAPGIPGGYARGAARCGKIRKLARSGTGPVVKEIKEWVGNRRERWLKIWPALEGLSGPSGRKKHGSALFPVRLKRHPVHKQ